MRTALNGLAVIVLLSASHAHAWGMFGHQVTGEIASRHLCAKTARAISYLLNNDSLAHAATWADEVRSEPDYRRFKPQHFVTMNLGGRYQDSPQPTRGDLVTGFHEHTTNLKNPLYAKRDEALKFLIHLTGDAHQPFHAGQHSDYGGNGIQLTWFGWPANLHQVWDTRMIVRSAQKVEDLANEIDTVTAPAVSQQSVEDWVTESSKVASQVYPAASELGFAYYEQNLPVAKERIRIAGHRLANLLNSTFGCD